MKYFLIILSFVFLKAQAQTFKVSDIQTTNQKHYQKIAKEALGSKITAVFYDNSVSLSLEGEGKPYILRKVNNGVFSFSEESRGEKVTYQAIFTKSVGVITTLQFTSTNKGNRMSFKAKREYF